MTDERARLARQALMLLALAAWAVVAHLASAGVGPASLRVLAATAPLLAAAALLLWRAPLPRLPAWGVFGALLALLAAGWNWLGSHLAWLFYLQHLGIHLSLAAWFGSSLLPGHEPVVSAMARLLAPSGVLTPRNQRYTRGVTLAWALFLLGSALVSTLLFAWAPVAVWSVYANLLTGPLLAAFFGLEMLVRRCALPPEERPSLADVLRAYRVRRAADTSRPVGPV